MATPIENVREDLIQLWSRLGPYWGISPTVARVYALLLTSAEPLDGDAISERLEMSRGGISMACRELLDWGLIHSERPTGSRRVAYRIEEDPEKVIRTIIATRKRREWDPLLEAVRGWTTDLSAQRSEEAKVLRGRLEEIEGLIQLVDTASETFLKGGLVPKLGLKALVKTARSKKNTNRSKKRPR